MKRKIPLILVDHFLQKTPKRIAQKIMSQHPYIKMNINSLPSDDIYTQTFLFDIQCDYLQNDYYHVRMTKQSEELANIFQKQSETDHNNKKQVKNQFEVDFVESIKTLSDNTRDPKILLQTDEFICLMTPSIAYQLRKYLIYLYKWVIKQEQKQMSGTMKDLIDQLKTTISGKMQQGYQEAGLGDNGKAELKRIELLEKAREGITTGDHKLAKTSYEALFEDEKSDPNTRMEALQYLCKLSIQKGDQSYLLKMIRKIQGDQKQDHHRKYILNKIEQMNKSVSQKRAEESK